MEKGGKGKRAIAELDKAIVIPLLSFPFSPFPLLSHYTDMPANSWGDAPWFTRFWPEAARITSAVGLNG